MLERFLGETPPSRGPGVVRALAGAASAVGGGLAARLRATADAVLDKAVSLGIRTAASSAFLIAAVVFLLAGLKEGLVALGAPDWAASLGLALAAGLAGWAILRGRPSVAGDGKKEEDEEREPRGFTLRIVREDRGARPEADAGDAPVIDVHPAPEGWEVSAPRGRRGPERFRTKREALRAARRAAKRRGGRIVVHRTDLSVQRPRRRRR